MTYVTSANGRKFIAKEEGNILYAYDDANEKRVNVGDVVHGTITIGVGHTSVAGAPKVVPGMTITAAQSDAILASDLKKVEAQVNSLVKVPLTQNQFDALVSFQFNTGGLAKSSTLRKLNAGDYKGAADALLAWSKANGNPTLLLNRRKRERTLFLAPDSKADKVSGPTSAVVIGGGLWYTLSQYIHNHEYLIIGGAIVAAIAVGVLVHFLRNKNG